MRGSHISVCVLVWVLIAMPAVRAQQKIPFVISVENVGAHFQAAATRTFAGELASRTGTSLNLQYYDGARLYRDAEAVRALAQGRIACAFPGIWQLDTMVPDTATFMLPSVYGRSIADMRALADGPLGSLINKKIEKVLNVVVIGPWLDLGYGHVFGARVDIASTRDLAGRRIRAAGGRGNEERLKALGASPVLIPSSDLPDYLRGGLLDGILSTYETVESANLDRTGLRSVLEDREYYPFYIPLVSRSTWEELTPSLRAAVVSCWRDVVAVARDRSVSSQNAAKKRLAARGMAIHVPEPAETARTRALLRTKEREIADRLSVSGEALALLRAAFPEGEDR